MITSSLSFFKNSVSHSMSGAIVVEEIEKTITDKFPLMGLCLVGLLLLRSIKLINIVTPTLALPEFNLFLKNPL